MFTVSALLCSMMALTIGAAVQPLVYKKTTSCPCGWTEYLDRCFIYIPEIMTWSEAQKNCQSMKANLASVRSFEEYAAIQKLTAFNGYRNTWIGGSDSQQEGFWFWIDGTPVTYTNWCPYQPDNLGEQHCIQMNYGARKCWDDTKCSTLYPSICAKKILG
ncbi:type-2 ice-structuring protein-like [Xyrichtys novacula]|uniref:Type-2 ice-structuring protein-like n=1 Tax=Xyrichtys novacula TaxID=13765 RepID=A0AAV1G6I8_XYRNO|nr:type-2 ice-structuring protein-like [Xyrichtys novacula]